MQAIKEMFRDVVEQVTETEMDDKLGRVFCQGHLGSFPYQLKDACFVPIYHEYVMGTMPLGNTFRLGFN